MAEDRKTCVECDGTMVEGFILDLTYGGQMVPRWIRGAPEASFWTGVKSSGKECYAVATLRCVQCGRLASYATEEASPPGIWGT